MNLKKLASAVHNNLVSGLGGATINQRFTIEQIEDAIINERLVIIKEYMAKNIIPRKDLMLSIRCLEVDCENMSQCCGRNFGIKTQHMQIPQIFNDYGRGSIDFIGSTDNEESFVIYTDNMYKNHKYRRNGKDKPYAYVDTTPNSKGFYDVFIFNAPFLKQATIRAIFKDPRQLESYGCCNEDEWDNYSFIERDLEKRVTENYLRYYRQFAIPLTPNDQTVKS